MVCIRKLGMKLTTYSSGALKGKEMELEQLQKEAQERLLQFQSRFKEGLKTLKQVTKDLKWTQQHVNSLRKHVEAKHPIEYSQSKDKVLSRAINIDEITNSKDKSNDYDDEEIYI